MPYDRDKVDSDRPDSADVFICHASEDKEIVVRCLAELLVKAGIRVWYDDYSLKLGDSLRREIDRGLTFCRFGVVVLSPAFLNKEWPQRELDGLVARETNEGRKVILPVWHELDVEEVYKYSPVLADRLGVKTSEGLSEVARRIVAAIGVQPSQAIPNIDGTWNSNFGRVVLNQEGQRISGEFESLSHDWNGKLDGEVHPDRVIFRWLLVDRNSEGVGYWLYNDEKLKGWWWNADECLVPFDALQKDIRALDIFPTSTGNEWNLERAIS